MLSCNNFNDISSHCTVDHGAVSASTIVTFLEEWKVGEAIVGHTVFVKPGKTQ